MKSDSPSEQARHPIRSNKAVLVSLVTYNDESFLGRIVERNSLIR